MISDGNFFGVMFFSKGDFFWNEEGRFSSEEDFFQEVFLGDAFMKAREIFVG